MEISNKTSSENINFINLRKAEKSDAKEIGRQDSIYFYDEKESENLVDEVEIRDDAEIRIETSYMIELNNTLLGKLILNIVIIQLLFLVLEYYRSLEVKAMEK